MPQRGAARVMDAMQACCREGSAGKGAEGQAEQGRGTTRLPMQQGLVFTHLDECVMCFREEGLRSPVHEHDAR